MFVNKIPDGRAVLYLFVCPTRSSRQVSEVLCRNLAHTFAFAGAGDLRARSCGRYCGRRWPRSELRACPPPTKRNQDKVMIPSRSLSLLCQTVSRFSTCETTDSLRNGGFLAIVALKERR